MRKRTRKARGKRDAAGRFLSRHVVRVGKKRRRASIGTRRGFDSCVRKVKRRGKARSAYAVCQAQAKRTRASRNPVSKNYVIAVIERKTHRVGFFDGRAFVGKPQAVLYRSKHAAATHGRSLRIPKRRFVCVVAPAHLTGAEILNHLTGGAVHNPAPKRGVARAARLYRGFTGERPKHLDRYSPHPLTTGAHIGQISRICYIAKRDGKRFEFDHVFRPSARPSFIVSQDGHAFGGVGGRTKFTSRGFVDR